MKGKGSRLAILLATVLIFVGAFGVTAFAADKYDDDGAGAVDMTMLRSGNNEHEPKTDKVDCEISTSGSVTTVKYKAEQLQYLDRESAGGGIRAQVGTLIIAPKEYPAGTPVVAGNARFRIKGGAWTPLFTTDYDDYDTQQVEPGRVINNKVWMGVNDDKVYRAVSTRKDIAYTFECDWNNDGDVDHTFNIAINVNNLTLLNLNGEKILKTVNGQVVDTVTFVGNDATSGEMAAQDVPTGTETALNSNKFKRTGYFFQGWSRSAGGEVEIADGGNIETDGDVTLYAVWEKHVHDFKIDNESGKRTVRCTDEECEYYKNPVVIETVAKDMQYAGLVTSEVTKTVDPENVVKLNTTPSYYKGDVEQPNCKTAGKYNVRYTFTVDGVEHEGEPIVNTTYKFFEVVKAKPVVEQNLKYDDGKTIITDDGLEPKDTQAVVLYKDPLTGGYVTRENLKNVGVPTTTESIIYKVMSSSAEDAEQLYKGKVNIVIDKLDVVVTGDNKEKYETQNDPTLTYTYQVEGKKEVTLNFEGELDRETGESAGVYAINQGDLHLTEADSENYRIFEYKEGYLTIKPETDEPEGLELTYTAENQPLVSAAKDPSDGVFQYSYAKTGSGEWSDYSTDVPEEKNAGKYTIRYRIVKEAAAEEQDPSASDILQQEKKVYTTIAQAELKVTAKDATTPYGVLFNPAGDENKYTVEGLLPSDADKLTVNLYMEEQYTVKAAAGTEWTIVSSGVLDSSIINNYEVTWVNGKLTVNKIKIKVSWTDYSGKYSGKLQSVVPSATYEPADAKPLGGKHFDLVDTKGINAGPYTAKVILHDDAIANNYEIVEGAEYNWDIEKAPLIVRAKDAEVVYGKAAPSFEMDDEDVGFVDGEGPEDIQGLKKFTTEYVMGAEVRDGGYAVTPVMRSFKSDNYEMTPEESTLTVTPSPVTVTWDYDSPIEYDGETHVVTPTLEGVMAADENNVKLVFKETSQHEAKDADIYTAKVKLAGTKANCYSIADGKNLNWEIAKREVYIKWTNTSFGFDGYDHGPKYEVKHVVKGENVYPFFLDTDSYNSTGMHADSYRAKVTGLLKTEEYPDAKNYILVMGKDDDTEVAPENPIIVPWKISRCPITVTWPSEDSFTYDGTKKSYEASYEPKEDIPGVEISLNYTGSTKEAVNVGNYDVTVNGFTVTDTIPDDDPIFDSDYKLVREDKSEITEAKPESHTWYIVPFELKVMADSKTINYGEAVPKLTYSVSPARPAAGEPIEATLDTTYYAGAKAGTYPITVKLGKNSNYKITAVDGTITVNAVNEAAKVLVAQGKASGNKAVKVSWNGVNGAAGYDVYFAKCNSKSRKSAPALKGSTSGNSLKIKKLKKGTCYKFYVVAKDASGNVIAQSPTGHFIAGNVSGKKTNAKSITANTKAVSLNKGGAYTLSTSQSKAKKGKKYKLLSGGHAALTRYISSNTAVATVDSNGVIRGVGAGNCKVYALAVNGMWAEVDVNVK